MNFEASRAKALDKLNYFVENNLSEYSKLRNFDFGPENRSNISCLSPYITHGIISEKEIIEKSLGKFSFSKNEKFIQEVLWRTYWKGWLELRPNVWSDYLMELNKIKEEFKNNQNYLNAIEGKTNIECFNAWINELKENNYLHNHTRMWFASIWIFTLKLPWQKGAEFFLKYLLDGDAASNTLSWRWVAGLQTKGKNYSAQSWNIEKFTNNKYKNIRLVENPIPLQDKREYKLTEIENFNNSEKVKNLIFFENDLNLENYNLDNYQNIYCLLIENDKRKIKLDQKVLDFKKIIIKNHLKTLTKNIKFLENSQSLNILDGVKEFDVIYPSIGENLSFIKLLNKTKDIKFRFLKNEKDLFCWNFSNKGYFNFKSNIPKIITKFKLS